MVESWWMLEHRHQLGLVEIFYGLDRGRWPWISHSVRSNNGEMVWVGRKTELSAGARALFEKRGFL